MGYMVHNGKRLIFLTHRCPIEYLCLSLHRLILNFIDMVQNVFTFCKAIEKRDNAVALDFSEEITKLNKEGWVVKQISTTSFKFDSCEYYAISVLAEKAV